MSMIRGIREDPQLTRLGGGERSIIEGEDQKGFIFLGCQKDKYNAHYLCEFISAEDWQRKYRCSRGRLGGGESLAKTSVLGLNGWVMGDAHT